ncbi:MAG: NAD-dependent epimerase/dehydratase family protein, partial [Actinobacteria bacterium]|nr:NAD-dependent epimerase/dehydratase family protein [Actinomycetota bacterium]
DRHCNSNFFDIREKNKLEELIKFCKPEVVFHLAAQPLVRESYNNPIDTYMTNVIGTANVFNAARKVVDAVEADNMPKCNVSKDGCKQCDLIP